jgi:membrane protein
MARLTDWIAVGKTVARIAYESDIRYLATSVSYYAFISFIPLLVLVFAIVGQQFANEIAALPARFVTPATRPLIYESLTTASGRTWAAVLSIVVLAWGGTNITVDFLEGVERIEAATDRPLPRQVRDAAIVLGTVLLAILAVLLQSLLVAVFADGPLGILLGFGVLLVALTLTFLPLYYVPSRVVTSLSRALPGALTTAFGWTVLHAAIQFYTANAAEYAIYGVLSGIILILTSTYIAAIILMTGVAVNAVIATEVDDLAMANA